MFYFAAGFREIVYSLSDVEKCQEHVRFYIRSSTKSADSADFLTYSNCLGAFFEYLEKHVEHLTCVLFLQLVPEKLFIVSLMSRIVRNRFKFRFRNQHKTQ